jgi:hypothetical protein
VTGWTGKEKAGQSARPFSLRAPARTPVSGTGSGYADLADRRAHIGLFIDPDDQFSIRRLAHDKALH